MTEKIVGGGSSQADQVTVGDAGPTVEEIGIVDASVEAALQDMPETEFTKAHPHLAFVAARVFGVEPVQCIEPQHALPLLEKFQKIFTIGVERVPLNRELKFPVFIAWQALLGRDANAAAEQLGLDADKEIARGLAVVGDVLCDIPEVQRRKIIEALTPPAVKAPTPKVRRTRRKAGSVAISGTTSMARRPDTDDVPEGIEEEIAPEALDDEKLFKGVSGNDVDTVQRYLKQEIGRVDLLTAEQVTELCKEIEAGLFAEEKLKDGEQFADVDATTKELEMLATQGKRAKNHLVEANLRFVVSIAKKYRGRGLPFLDVIQEGNIGLIKAVQKFDHTRGYKFTTYAGWWIRQAIERGIADQARVIRLPVHVVGSVNKLSWAESERAQQEGSFDSDIEAVAVEMGNATTGEIEEWRRARDMQPFSFAYPVNNEDGSDTELGDLIEDADTPSPEKQVEQMLANAALRDTMIWLAYRETTERAIKILLLHSGFVDADMELFPTEVMQEHGIAYGKPMTYKQIAKIFGTSVTGISIQMKLARAIVYHPSVRGLITSSIGRE